MAHKWARWLHSHCRLWDPHRFRAGGRIRSGPQVGRVATQPLPRGAPPPLQTGEQNEKWPTNGPGGSLTLAGGLISTASERGAESEVGHKWAGWLHSQCRVGDPHRFRAGGQNQKWPTSGPGGSLTPAALGVPTAHSGGHNQKWPTSGPGGYTPPAVWGIPTASERGAESEVAHKWAGGYIALAACGIPTASQQGAESEVAHKWARWLHNPCRLGGPHRFRAGGRMRSGPQVGLVAT